jgi:hypothetical protein
MTAVGLTFARAFISDAPYDTSMPGADQGEAEYEIPLSMWHNSRE